MTSEERLVEHWRRAGYIPMIEDGKRRMREIIILQPWLDQAQSLARFLRMADKESRIIGAITEEIEPDLILKSTNS